MLMAVPHCLRLLPHWALKAAVLARFRAGSNIAARMAMMAMTTSSSMRVKALDHKPNRGFFIFGYDLTIPQLPQAVEDGQRAPLPSAGPLTKSQRSVPNLLCRRFPIGKAAETSTHAGWKPAARQVENLRYADVHDPNAFEKGKEGSPGEGGDG
jgi:hypothetical protein